MINIRYHIVSITAVFLALGIGAALGSTFLDRYTVNRIDDNVRSAEIRIKDTKDRNAALANAVVRSTARDDSLIEDAPAVLFTDQLRDTKILVITSPGVAQDLINSLDRVLLSAGADVRGTMELRDQLRFEGKSVDATLADALGTAPSDVGAARRVVFRELQRALVDAGRPAAAEVGPDGAGETTTVPGETPPAPPTETTETTETTMVPPDATAPPANPEQPPASPTTVAQQPAIVTSLLDTGYLRLTPGAGHTSAEPILAEPGYRYVFVTAAGLEPADDAALLRLLPTSGTADALPALVVSATAPTPDPTADKGEQPQPSAVTAVRDSSVLAGRYDTVDDLDTIAGMAATVTVLRDLGTVPAGHYGQGPGATAILPPRP